MSSMTMRSLWVRLGKSHYLQMSDGQLWELVRTNDTNAFCVLYDRHKAIVTDFYFGLYQNVKKAQKETIQLFINLYQSRLEIQAPSFLEALFSHALRAHQNRPKGHARTVLVDEWAFLTSWTELTTEEVLEVLESMSLDKASVLLVWLLTDLSPESQSALLRISVAEWQRLLGAAMGQWFDNLAQTPVLYSRSLSEQQRALKNKAKKAIHLVFDQETDFLFWARFEKECQKKSFWALFWAPTLIVFFLSLILVSAFFKQELPGQAQEERGAFSLRKIETEKSLTAPTSGDQPLSESDL